MKHMFGCAMLNAEKKSAQTQSAPKQGVRKADVILFAMTAGIAAAVFLFFQADSKEGAYARVFFDGRLEAQIPLDQKETEYYLFKGQHFYTFSEKEWQEADFAPAENEESFYNAFRCLDSEIEMIQSNCRDLICVHHAPISRTGENIICLPHRIVIEIIGADEVPELDGVVY